MQNGTRPSSPYGQHYEGTEWIVFFEGAGRDAKDDLRCKVADKSDDGGGDGGYNDWVLAVGKLVLVLGPSGAGD